MTPLTFLVFASGFCRELDCQFRYGAGCAVAAPFAAALAAWAFWKIKPYSQHTMARGRPLPAGMDLPISDDAPPGTVHVSQELLGNGLVKTLVITVHDDGSRTVEEIVETHE